MLFGIGTDYFLCLMYRYRERLRLGEDKKHAIVQSVTRVGEVIASATDVDIAAFLALTLSSLSIFRSLGPTLAIAVAVTLVAALTLIPAVVSLIGTAVFWPSKSWQREPKAAGSPRPAAGWARGRGRSPPRAAWSSRRWRSGRCRSGRRSTWGRRAFRPPMLSSRGSGMMNASAGWMCGL